MAQKVVVAPTEVTALSAPDYIGEVMEGRTVEAGDGFSISSRGRRVGFRIVETEPEGRVVAGPRTVVVQLDGPVGSDGSS